MSNEIKKEEVENEIPKNFDNKEAEPRIYKLWEESGYFSPEKVKELNNNDLKPFVITLPPPNANGSLHLGHVSGYTIQDLMGRFNRMTGRPTLLLPGKDHAGIQTEVVFEKFLEKKGIKKREIGRDKFYEECYKFCIEQSAIARGQEKNIGLSADFLREKFTLDPALTKVIMETFEKMFNEGLIYRGKRIINWCVKDQTSLANIDTENIEEDGFLYDIRYKIEGESDQYITVSTTRPETMFGDTAVAVSLKDKRYKNLIGKNCIVPYINRAIPIITDFRIDKDFGTGAVKVTPAHSEIDYSIGKDHNLEAITVINKYGKMVDGETATYGGLSVNDCRKKLVMDLKNDGFLISEKPHKHSVPVCERCKNKIESLLQWQWFVRVDEIKKGAIDAVLNKETVILPKAQEKLYLRWFDTLEDWCISRQLWWGHRIPIWYCGGKDYSDSIMEGGELKVGQCGYKFVSTTKVEECPKCGNQKIEEETDVLDTWYSSGHWPISTLGGLDGDDFKKYYPTDVLETGFDILTFWIARMMLIGTYRTNRAPFHSVYLHGLVTDKDGKKMSKSRNNGIDPHEMIQRYGADALRYSFVHGNSAAQNYRLYEEKIDSFRKFVNKVWNGARFSILQFDNLNEIEKLKVSELSNTELKSERLKELNKSGKKITKNIRDFKFGLASVEIYQFWWHTFCDKYIEEIKSEITTVIDSKRKLKLLAELLKLLKIQLKIIHPFMPFVTEEIWQYLGERKLLSGERPILMVANWPY